MDLREVEEDTAEIPMLYQKARLLNALSYLMRWNKLDEVKSD